MRFLVFVHFLTACSSANVFSSTKDEKNKSQEPPNQSGTTTSNEQERADIPVWVNSSYLTCAWGDERSDEQVEVDCGLSSTSPGPAPTSLTMECKTFATEIRNELPSVITNKDLLNLRILIAGNLVATAKVQCALTSSLAPQKVHNVDVEFTQQLQELAIQTFVDCLAAPQQGGTKVCFTAAPKKVTDRSSTCGSDESDNCYTGSRAAAAIEAGLATTPKGKSLTFNQKTNVWEETDGTRVLASDGSDFWAMQLNADGRSYSDQFLDKTNVAGRVCPANVFTPQSLTTTGKCLYYDSGNLSQRLDAPSHDGFTDQNTIGSFRLGTWNVATSGNGEAGSWYEGNIETCAAKGMRLPTLYETDASGVGQPYLPVDADPQWLKPKEHGVPSVDSASTWTASAYLDSQYFPNVYWIWSADSTNNTSIEYPQAVRCVIP